MRAVGRNLGLQSVITFHSHNLLENEKYNRLGLIIDEVETGSVIVLNSVINQNEHMNYWKCSLSSITTL